MSSLIVSLPLEPATSATEWAFALTSDGRVLADHGKTPAALLPQPRGAGSEVVAVVPAQALAWQRVTVPKGIAAGTPRQRSALEGLLEEHLLDDTDAVHLALQPGARPGDTAWVAICDRTWLRDALQLLERAGRPASRIVPEFAPEGAAALVVLGDAEQPTVVASSEDGVLVLPLTPAALALLPQWPEDAPRLAEPAVAGIAEQLLQQKVVLQQAPQRWVQAARTRWDLAQFEFASSSRSRALKKFSTGWAEVLNTAPWRPARWAAVLLLAVNLVGLNAWAWKERAGLEGKREAIRRSLTDTFPQVKLVVDAPLQMEREVSTLRQQTGMASPRDIDALLGALAAALPAGRMPTAINYSGSDLRVTGLGLSPDELRALVARLRPFGYTATAAGDILVVSVEDAR